MIKHRLVIVLFALIGAIAGAGLAATTAPKASQYTVSAHVVLVPAPDLTTVEASNFWEVLTRGQMTRTAAILYGDGRWVPAAADAAKVARGTLTLTAAALPETTMLNVTVTTSSAAAAEAGLNEVLTTATPEVSAMVQPYFVKVIWPPKDSAYPLPAPGGTQLAAGGGLGGLLLGGALGWLLVRWRNRRPAAPVSNRPDVTARDGGPGVTARDGGPDFTARDRSADLTARSDNFSARAGSDSPVGHVEKEALSQ